MRTDDPAILKQIQGLEQLAANLRRICGFEPLTPLPETTASRAPKWCSACNLGFTSTADLEHHRRYEHKRLPKQETA